MYDVILADPCWPYRNVKTGGSHTSGSAQQYPTMTLHEISSMGAALQHLANRDSVCFLWATTPLGQDPFLVLNDWDFAYKTKWYWHKVGRKGIGYWTRGCVEEVLIGVRGGVKAWRSNLDNWIDAIDPTPDDFTGIVESKPQGHSRKPAIVRTMIEQLTPGARRVELFATERVPGWDAYGMALDLRHDFRSPEFWEELLGHHPNVPRQVRRQRHRAQGGPGRDRAADSEGRIVPTGD